MSVLEPIAALPPALQVALALALCVQLDWAVGRALVPPGPGPSRSVGRVRSRARLGVAHSS